MGFCDYFESYVCECTCVNFFERGRQYLENKSRHSPGMGWMGNVLRKNILIVRFLFGICFLNNITTKDKFLLRKLLQK